MSLKGIREDLQGALRAITGLNVYSGWPSKENAPFAIISLPVTDGAEYDLTSRNSSLIYHFVIDVGVKTSASIEQMQDDLDPYIENTGDLSIKLALETMDDAGSHPDFDSLRVGKMANYGQLVINGTNYTGARFNVDIIVTS
jgi:hypothetical protein